MAKSQIEATIRITLNNTIRMLTLLRSSGRAEEILISKVSRRATASSTTIHNTRLRTHNRVTQVATIRLTKETSSRANRIIRPIFTVEEIVMHTGRGLLLLATDRNRDKSPKTSTISPTGLLVVPANSHPIGHQFRMKSRAQAERSRVNRLDLEDPNPGLKT
jgi:hypothetical protein